MSSIDKETFRTLHERAFALTALRHYDIYLDLKDRETDPALQALFSELALIAKEEFSFWGTKTGVRGDEATNLFGAKLAHRILRRTLGVTLTTHLMINRERHKLRHFTVYCVDCINPDERKAIETMIARSLALVPASEDPHFKFFSSVILGFNDAVIELTGALIGFSLALGEPKIVIVAGLISGVTAAASIASSAYLEAEHETGKDPHRAAFYTGFSYLATAILLVVPFMWSPTLLGANLIMIATAFLLVSVLSLYSAVILGKSYLAQLRQMLGLSFGVMLVAFSIGHLLNVLVDRNLI